jgi:hypothetical protein
MPRVSLAFFSVAALYAIIGMSWGIFMGASQDHSMYPAHAHLNLLGWVTMSIYGIFYALAGARVSARAPWITFALSNIGLVILIPSLALILRYGELPQYIVPISIGEILTVAGMISFGVSVWGMFLKSGGPISAAPKVQPAE